MGSGKIKVTFVDIETQETVYLTDKQCDLKIPLESLPLVGDMVFDDLCRVWRVHRRYWIVNHGEPRMRMYLKKE
jgi:hypothetical protein